MNTKPIGIIDSGIGGLSVASVLINKLPKESIIYLADSKNCPYGQKSPEEIYKLTTKMVDFLLSKNIKLLLVACNTITVTSIEKLRKNYPNLPIVGIVPVIKTAVNKSKSGKVGIFSTRVTAKSEYQKKLIKRYAKDKVVLNIGSDNLVENIENLDFVSIDKVLEKELKPFIDENIDVLALGCSHFPLIYQRIKKRLPNVLILNSAGAVGRQVEKILNNNKILSNSNKASYNFYTTGNLIAIEFYVNKLTKPDKIEKISLL